jgi:hypothetical protein
MKFATPVARESLRIAVGLSFTFLLSLLPVELSASERCDDSQVKSTVKELYAEYLKQDIELSMPLAKYISEPSNITTDDVNE